MANPNPPLIVYGFQPVRFVTGIPTLVQKQQSLPLATNYQDPVASSPEYSPPENFGLTQE